MIASDVMQSAQVNIATAAGTVSAGVSSWLGWIPADIGLLAVFSGSLLSLTLTLYRIMLIRREYIEQKIMKENHKKSQNRIITPGLDLTKK